jgi:hypothetical protein
MLASVVGHVQGVDDLLHVEALTDLPERCECGWEPVGVARCSSKLTDRVLQRVPPGLRLQQALGLAAAGDVYMQGDSATLPAERTALLFN